LVKTVIGISAPTAGAFSVLRQTLAAEANFASIVKPSPCDKPKTNGADRRL
jgi:hypothetical protein